MSDPAKFRDALIWSAVRELLRINQNAETARAVVTTVLDTVEAAIRQDEREACAHCVEGVMEAHRHRLCVDLGEHLHYQFADKKLAEAARAILLRGDGRAGLEGE